MQRGELKNEKLHWPPYERGAPRMVGSPLERTLWMIQKKIRMKVLLQFRCRAFKSIAAESRIEVRPLTILAGANSSGKSSIMQPLLLMKQTLEASYDPGPLLLNGPNAKFTSANQFISRLQKNSDGQAFSIGIEHAKGRTLKVVFSLSKNQTLEIEKNGHWRGQTFPLLNAESKK